MSVDPNVDARMKKFMADVQDLMREYDMEIAVIGLSTRATAEGFVTFAAAIRDRNQPVAEALEQLDAIRTDITGVYDEIGKSIAQQLMAGDGMRERIGQMLDGLKTLQTAAEDHDEPEEPQSVADIVEALRKPGADIRVIRLGSPGAAAGVGTGKKGKTFLN